MRLLSIFYGKNSIIKKADFSYNSYKRYDPTFSWIATRLNISFN